MEGVREGKRERERERRSNARGRRDGERWGGRGVSVVETCHASYPNLLCKCSELVIKIPHLTSHTGYQLAR